MPNLKHLLEELEEFDVDPRQVKLPGPVYDDPAQQAEDNEEELVTVKENETTEVTIELQPR